MGKRHTDDTDPMFDIEATPEYVSAPDVARMAEQLIRRHSQTELAPLVDLPLVYMFQTLPFDPKKESLKHETVGKAIKAPTVWREITGHAGIVWIRQWFWDRFDERRRAGVLFHELLHFSDSEGGPDGKVRLRDHDVEEFASVVRHYGGYLPGRREFVDAFLAFKPTEDEAQAKPLGERVMDAVMDAAEHPENAPPDVQRALGRLAKAGEGVDSVTIKRGDRSVTLPNPNAGPHA